MTSPEQPHVENGPGDFGRSYAEIADQLERQKWEQDVVAFREAIKNKMDPYIGPDRGWLHYEYQHVNPVSGEFETKQVVLIRLPSEGKRSSKKDSPPMIKIVTNETFEYRDEKHCLSEDILIDYDNDALYYVDACMLEGPEKEEFEFSEALPFEVHGDDRIHFPDFQWVPPHTNIAEDGDPLVIPFGVYSCREDNQYALKKAWEILSEVWEEEPRHTGTS